MLWLGRHCSSTAATLILVASLTSPISSFAQQPARADGLPAPASAAATDAIEYLKTQVQELHGALGEIRQQLTNSRRESQELRQALQEVQERLISLDRGQSGPEIRLASQTRDRATVPSSSSGEVSQRSEPLLAGQAANAGDPVATLQEEQQLLNSKVETQYQTKIESGSRHRVRISGLMLLGIFGTRGAVDNLDLPSVAERGGALDSNGSFGASVRQSQFGIEVFGPSLGRARTSGEIQFDFFGGFPATENGVSSGLMRIRTAKASFDWPHTSAVAGQDVPFFSPLSPTSLAATAVPAFSYSGNLWSWTPQLRVDHHMALSDASNLLFQGGILDPLTGDVPPSQFERTPSAGEKSRQPAYATRIAWTHAAYGRQMTVGGGAFYSRQNWGLGRAVDSWAATADWELPMGRWLTLSGEFYRGRALGAFGAGNFSSVLFSGPLENRASSVWGLNSSGGWSQLKFMPTEKIEFNGAFGEDYPFSADLHHFPVQTLQTSSYGELHGRNASAFSNIIFHARSNLLFSVEYRRLWTTGLYGTKRTADHVNASVGVLF